MKDMLTGLFFINELESGKGVNDILEKIFNQDIERDESQNLYEFKMSMVISKMNFIENILKLKVLNENKQVRREIAEYLIKVAHELEEIQNMSIEVQNEN